MTKFVFLQSHRCTLLTLGCCYAPLPRKLRGLHAPILLFNSGNHLYADVGFPRWYHGYEQPLQFLSYRNWCGEGDHWNGVRVQHLGHLYGVNGGDAQVRLSYRGFVFQQKLIPCRLYVLVDCGEAVGLFMHNRTAVLPKNLLPIR